MGNTLRRTLLRQDPAPRSTHVIVGTWMCQDLFRTYAAVAFRLRYRSYNDAASDT